MASWAAIWLCWHYLWVINMASRLASGGINLAGSSSSYNVSAAAGPTWIITARWNREAGTKQNKTQQGRVCWRRAAVFSYSSNCLFFDFLFCFFSPAWIMWRVIGPFELILTQQSSEVTAGLIVISVLMSFCLDISQCKTFSDLFCCV